MKAALPDLTKSYYRKIDPPPEYYLLGNSSRRKIIRAVQYHFNPPPVLPETNQFIEMFDYLSSNIKDHWGVQEQYSSCRWVVNQNRELAASMLIHFGWAQRDREPMAGSSIHRLTIVPQGIYVEIMNNHTFNQRLTAACEKIKIEYDHGERLSIDDPRRPNLASLTTIGMKEFRFHSGFYCSIPAEYNQSAKGKMVAYIEALRNKLKTEDPEMPTIEEPDDILPTQSFTLKWEDFEFQDGLSYAQTQRNRSAAANQCLKSIQPKLDHLPQGPSHLYRRGDLPIDKNRLVAAKKHGFMSQPKYGHYILHYPRADEDE